MKFTANVEFVSVSPLDTVSVCVPTKGRQLYAEPSAILYIRTNFNLDDVVIVSPDAGGAKR